MMVQYFDRILPACRADMTNEQAQEIYSRSWSEDLLNTGADPLLSVVIPYFRAGEIGWLPLEALSRQVGVDFPWELVIMEEALENPYGPIKISDFGDRLHAAGCVRVRYVSNPEWIPLSAKWYYLIKECSDSSKVVAFNSADVYCSKHRLREQFKLLAADVCNWHKLSGNLVYDISLDKHVKRISINEKAADTACRAITMELARKLPLAMVKKSVDGWVYNTLSFYGIRYVYDTSDMWSDTVNVNGLNNISMRRKDRISRVIPPLSVCCKDLANHLPSEVVDRLRSCRVHVDAHREALRRSPIKIAGQ